MGVDDAVTGYCQRPGDAVGIGHRNAILAIGTSSTQRWAFESFSRRTGTNSY
jgi:hypothetical protein